MRGGNRNFQMSENSIGAVDSDCNNRNCSEVTLGIRRRDEDEEGEKKRMTLTSLPR